MHPCDPAERWRNFFKGIYRGRCRDRETRESTHRCSTRERAKETPPRERRPWSHRHKKNCFYHRSDSEDKYNSESGAGWFQKRTLALHEDRLGDATCSARIPLGRCECQERELLVFFSLLVSPPCPPLVSPAHRIRRRISKRRRGRRMPNEFRVSRVTRFAITRKLSTCVHNGRRVGGISALCTPMRDDTPTRSTYSANSRMLIPDSDQPGRR